MRKGRRFVRSCLWMLAGNPQPVLILTLHGDELEKSKKKIITYNLEACNCLVADKDITFFLKCHFSYLNGLIFLQTDIYYFFFLQAVFN